MTEERNYGGRPKLFDNKEEFEKLAEEYFKSKTGQKISWTGLCLSVGASSRESLEPYKHGDYDDKNDKQGERFSDSIKRALLIVENFYEENDGGAKDIFALKNFNWRDQLDLGGAVDLGKEKLTDAELDAKIQEKLHKLGESE